ncbi:carbonic anhydrase [Lichenicola cladoniae]|uniref:Carbonic anhydrase n=1 Tax=Lichenicola cladoniae TaxID=1484109 RepID=A0A6M8HNG6_9PROT|nr:carbonic anhydrase [Lichenicola cladoniae]NPD67503.1 carbonic anhydrase [Acetobacteraceae bacterium]QKE89973.1 carbonic anhydrase [Lichenicola cladoniae]
MPAAPSVDHHHSIISLLEGVRDFNVRVFPEKQEMFSDLAAGQSPHTLFIACADSRVSPGMITQQPPGAMFVLRNIGNIVPAYGEMLGGVSAAIEYAVVALGVKHIIVCGHSDCGAMKAMLDPEAHGLDSMPTVASWLRNAETARAVTAALHPHAHGADAVAALAEQNVLLQLDHLRTHPAVAARIAEGPLLLQGWLYDIATGKIRVFDGQTRVARTLDEALSALKGAEPA